MPEAAGWILVTAWLFSTGPITLSDTFADDVACGLEYADLKARVGEVFDNRADAPMRFRFPEPAKLTAVYPCSQEVLRPLSGVTRSGGEYTVPGGF